MNSKIKVFLEILLMILYVIGYVFIKDTGSFNIFLIMVVLILIRNIVVVLKNYIDNIVFIAFNFLIFLFLLSRPLLSFLINYQWWYIDEESTWVALFIIGLSLQSIYIGKLLSDIVGTRATNTTNFLINKRLLMHIFIIFGLLRYAVEIDRYIVLKDSNYSELYTGYQLHFPAVVVSISHMFTYIFIFYLATLPNKKLTYSSIFYYFGTVVPGVLLGERSSLAILVVFTFIYIMIRSKINPEEGWFNKTRFISLGIILFILIFILSAIENIRSTNLDLVNTHEFNPVLNFIYLQGTSFDTVVQGVYYANDIRALENINYSFGTIIDKIKYSLFSQYLFGVPSLEAANGILNSTISNNSAHKLSRLSLGDWSYFSGHGRGTSYIVDNFLDFGHIGVVIFSIILGFVIGKISSINFRNPIIFSFALIFIFNLLMLPRLNYSHAINYLIDFKFYIVLILILVISNKTRGKERD